MHLKKYLVPVSMALFFSHLSFAEFENTSYSFFSVGSDRITYSESLPSFAGTSIESGLSAHALAQRSGGYTALSKESEFGFFITSQSTLISADGQETLNANWDNDSNGINDGEKPVLTDQASVSQANLDLQAAYHFKNGFFITSGIHYQKISFTRFGFSSTDNTNSFSDFTLDNSSTYATLKNEIENGDGSAKVNGVEYTNDADLREALRFNPEAQTPVVAEDLTAFNIVAGVGYDSFFINRNRGMRYKFHANIGTPAYLHVLNTNVTGTDRSLSGVFSGGLDVNANGSIGYQFNEKISVMASLSLTYVYRDSIKVENGSQTISLPNNTFTVLSPEIAFYWAF